MLPKTAGISLKAQHYQEVLETNPNVGWFEVHPENYMGEGGLPHHFLNEIHHFYPLSMHGVGLSLASAEGVDKNHLKQLAEVIHRHQPQQVSEHLAWSRWHGVCLNDLLPIPYTQEFLTIVVENVLQVQDTLKRKILIENPSVYLAFAEAEFTETDFLRELVRQTSCGLLLDINNVYVCANNQGFCVDSYLKSYPLEKVEEIHLAGHAQDRIDDQLILIDDHGSSVIDPVWQFYRSALLSIGQRVPVLIEWDTNIPSLQTLVSEANKAQNIMDECFVSENNKNLEAIGF